MGAMIHAIGSTRFGLTTIEFMAWMSHYLSNGTGVLAFLGEKYRVFQNRGRNISVSTVKLSDAVAV